MPKCSLMQPPQSHTKGTGSHCKRQVLSFMRGGDDFGSLGLNFLLEEEVKGFFCTKKRGICSLAGINQFLTLPRKSRKAQLSSLGFPTAAFALEKTAPVC